MDRAELESDTSVMQKLYDSEINAWITSFMMTVSMPA
jgi:hypothetical protein